MDRRPAALRRLAPRLALVLLAGGSLAACATPSARFSGPIGEPNPGTTRAPPPSAFIDPDTGKPLRGTMKPYQVKGLWYYPHEQPDYDVGGLGSWYGEQFHNHQTSDGEMFDMDSISAAHKTLPLPSLVEVTNLENGRKMIIRVNDRGPFVGDRIIDLSRAAADQLGYREKGVTNVRVRYIGPAPAAGAPRQQIATAGPPPVIASPPPETPAQRFAVRDTQRLAETAGYRIQAGAFSDRDNAQRCVEQLAAAGPAVIEPVERAGGTLYRVVVGPAPDEPMAWALRDRVAALGFHDASILRP
jgi:rare lipoprotein A